MEKAKIFFSYSRVDSVFTLQLAKTLVNAGLDVWLDQFDIGVGEKWDREIQKALASAETLLVVLSATSVNSENVMDEVAYALDEGKQVVPVLIGKCDIPLRLRRLQYADFTKSSEDGLATLCNALHIGESKKPGLIENFGKDRPGEQDITGFRSDIQESRTSGTRKKSLRLIVGALIIFVPLLIFGIWYLRNKHSTAEPGQETPDAQSGIPPISFNVAGNGITLIYNSHTLMRKDTFIISGDKTVGDLKEALISHYNIRPPKELLIDYDNGNAGFRLREILTAEFRTLADQQKLSEAGLNDYDVIEFQYQKIVPMSIDSSRIQPVPIPKVRPIAFNVGRNSITLVYNSLDLMRKDTFRISGDKTVEELKEALIRHYKIRAPRELSEVYRNGSGGFQLRETLTAEFKTLSNPTKLSEAGLHDYDVIEFRYLLVNSQAMACRITNVLVTVQGLASGKGELLLNGSRKPSWQTAGDSSTRFFFRVVSECNPGSWYCRVVENRRVYYLHGPEYHRDNDTLYVNFQMPK